MVKIRKALQKRWVSKKCSSAQQEILTFIPFPFHTGCMYEGQKRADGSSWLSSSAPCMFCMCVDGVTTCAKIACVSSCINQVEVPGECCPLCAGMKCQRWGTGSWGVSKCANL